MSPRETPPVESLPMSVINYYTARLQMFAIQAYWYNRTNYGDIKTILETACAQLAPMTRYSSERLNQCPWNLCDDNSCRPSCEG